VDQQKLRAWWSHRQGLDGSLAGARPAEVLERTGWARSVGGANPYLTLFARAGIGKEAAEKAYAGDEIYELPSARGCVYVLPRRHYTLGLTLAGGDAPDIGNAIRHLGVTEQELDSVSKGVLEALKSGVKAPKDIKAELGDTVRSFGDLGKKYGITSTLPLVLGRLQTEGRIRRVSGRFDTQSFSYALWDPSPLNGHVGGKAEALAALADMYFDWIAPASLEHFRWFAGCGVKAAQQAAAPLGLVEIGDGLLLPPKLQKDFAKFGRPSNPEFSLVTCLDSILLLKRDAAALLNETDLNQGPLANKELQKTGGLQDLPHHAILDRGRVVGLWEYDADHKQIAYMFWGEEQAGLAEALERTRAFIADELGDARSFSLDSPKSRAAAIASMPSRA
jgi:hypothetical protein